MFPVLLKIGPVTIYTYGVLVFLGIVIGYFVSLSEAKKSRLELETFKNIVFWSILWGFIGARVFYIIVEFEQFIKSPFKIIFSRAGFVFYGGLLSGILTSYILARKNRINFLKFADVLSFAVPVAHAIGRLGCFSYGCCYGRPTDSFIGVVFPIDSPVIYRSQKVIPTQLIEAGILFLIFFVLKFLRHKKKFDGQIFFLYLIFYSTMRFFIEFFRGDPRGVLWIFSISQWLSIAMFVFTFIAYFIKHKKLQAN